MTRTQAFCAPLVLALAALVAGCGDQAAAPAEQGGEASGEVLAGSVSDAMIPLDQLTSEAPIAPRQAGAPGDLDAEQPVVTPAEGIDGAPTSEGAGAAPATPAPQTPPEG
jgi:hypothetical protein